MLPSDDAAEAWSIIEPHISPHFKAEDGVMLLRAERYARILPEVLHRVRKCRCKLRKVVTAIETARFESVTDAETGAADRALCALAVCLDDAIDAEERKIFPAMPKAIFEMDRGA